MRSRSFQLRIRACFGYPLYLVEKFNGLRQKATLALSAVLFHSGRLAWHFLLYSHFFFSTMSRWFSTFLWVAGFNCIGHLAALGAPPSPSHTVVKGHFTHAPAGDSVRVRYGTHHAQAALSASGDFQLALPDLERASAAELSYAGQRTPLYLLPGDQLHLTLDFAHFDETLVYTGRGSAANNYLARSLWQFEYGPGEHTSRPLDQLTAATTPGQLRAQADVFRAKRQAFLRTYAAAHPLPAIFARDAAQHIDLQWASTLLAYPGVYKLRFDEAVVLPATYFQFMAQLPLTTLAAYVQRNPSEEGTVIPFLLDCAASRYLLPTGSLSADSAAGRALYAQATQTFGHTYYRDIVVLNLLVAQLQANNLAGVQATYPAFRVQTRDSALQQSMRRMLWAEQRLGVGQVAPAFALTDNRGRSVSLSELRGKVVYLDFWGTWCKPCLAEMPASRHLKEQFAGRDVVFVYISVNDAEEKWQRVLTEAQLTSPASVHLRARDQQIAELYDVRGFPSYYLIGRDGRIVLPHAPRPSAAKEAAAAIERALAG
jgi:peroxiredoxin